MYLSLIDVLCQVHGANKAQNLEANMSKLTPADSENPTGNKFLTFIGYPGIYHVSNVCINFSL